MRERRDTRSSSSRTHRLEELDATVEVRRHPAARRMTLRVSRTRRAVVVTLPPSCDLGEAGSFIKRHLDWVRERLDGLPELVPLEPGAVIPLRGAPHEIQFTGLSGAGVVTADSLRAGRHPALLVGGRAERGSRLLLEWLMEEARRDLDARVLHHARRMKLRPKRIVVRDQTSRWGSCSTTGVLSFSWRLILAPPEILDYVAAHEVAHLAEMNHGPRFWALVATAVPRLDAARDWLRVYGVDLHRYGPPSRA